MRATQRDRDRQTDKETEKERDSPTPTRLTFLPFHHFPLLPSVVSPSEVNLKSHPWNPIPSAFCCTQDRAVNTSISGDISPPNHIN